MFYVEVTPLGGILGPLLSDLGKTSTEKKHFLSGMNEGGGGLPMPEFLDPFSRSAFLVNKKGLFLQKCIELLTVF